MKIAFIKKKLSIVVLTYRRPSQAKATLETLYKIKGDSPESIELVVVDDSADGRFEFDYNNKLCRKLINNKNLGFRDSLIKGIKAATGDYILYLADDDIPIEHGILELINFIQFIDFDFGSTVFEFTNGNIRGRRKTSLLREFDFFNSSYHAPGIVFNKYFIERIIQSDQFEKISDLYFTSIFPQVSLVLCIIALNGRCLWLPIKTVEEKSPQISNLKDPNGRHYKDPLSRLNQLESCQKVLTMLSRPYNNNLKPCKLFWLLKTHNDTRDLLKRFTYVTNTILSPKPFFISKVITNYPVEYLKLKLCTIITWSNKFFSRI